MNLIFKFLLSIGTIVTSVLIIEGIRSTYFFSAPHQSLMAIGYDQLQYILIGENSNSDKDFLSADIKQSMYLSEEKEFLKIMPALKKINAGVGNTDYFDLITEDSEINGFGTCMGMKPNSLKKMVQIRSKVFHPKDPPVIFFDKDAKVAPELAVFLKKYGMPEKTISTNQWGERNTVPLLVKKRKVLVVGDSVALGVGVSDEETLASVLQRADQKRQYITIAIGGADTEQIMCDLDEALKRYSGQVDEIVYVVCDNDFRIGEEKKPADVLDSLQTIKQENGISKIAVVRAPYIYTVVPFMPESESSDRERADYISKSLKLESAKKNFDFFDIDDLAAEEVSREGSIFASLLLFADHVHLSKRGIQRLGEKILRLPRE